jgi:hypothetical protein
MEQIFQQWLLNKTPVRAEVVGGHVSLWFTGTVSRCAMTNLVLERGTDELSISLFCCKYRLVEPPANIEPEGAWQQYRRIVQVQTDGGASCTLYELRTSDSK